MPKIKLVICLNLGNIHKTFTVLRHHFESISQFNGKQNLVNTTTHKVSTERHGLAILKYKMHLLQ